MAIGTKRASPQITDCSLGRADVTFASIGEIRRASGEYRRNRHNPDAIETINQYRRFRLNCVQTSLSMLNRADLPDRVFLSARLKRLASIYRKLKRNELRHIEGSVSEMDDIIGFRVICRTYSDAIALASSVRCSLSARVKDYIKEIHATGSGYRAIHAVIKFDQPFRENSVRSRFEVQIRTWFQHLWACWCESFGERAKEGFPNPSDREALIKNQLVHQSQNLMDWEVTHADHEQHELMEISDIYNVAVAWQNEAGILGFDPFTSDIPKAANHLNYMETQSSVNPLLLIGVTSEHNLWDLLRGTHPKFMSHETLDPEYWMPTTD